MKKTPPFTVTITGKKGVFFFISKRIVPTAVKRNIIKRWGRHIAATLHIETVTIRVHHSEIPLSYDELYRTMENALR